MVQSYQKNKVKKASVTIMAAKFIVLAVCVALVKAGGIPVAAPIAAPLTYAAPFARVAAAPIAVAAPVAKAVAVAEEYDPNPQYSYGYDIQDALTGDSKSHVESRSGDLVQGSYSLTDPDGTRRTVEYVADPINGFNAVVHKEALAVKTVAAAAPIAAYAAPVTKIAAAPLAYAAPARIAAPLTYAAPIAKIGTPLAYSTSVLH